jgi:anti-sigma regulatory factor (Ser/Thr protein kinase)
VRSALDTYSDGGLSGVRSSEQNTEENEVTVVSAERELEFALSEQARRTARYEQSIGTTAELSAHERLRASNRRVSVCDRKVREQRAGLVQFAFSLSADAMAPAYARNEATGRLRGQVDRLVVQTVELLVSETVTNAVVHGVGAEAAAIDVEGRCLADRVRIDVTNCGPYFDHVPELPSATDPNGRGLFLVDHLACAWGSEHAATATRVWFEVAA